MAYHNTIIKKWPYKRVARHKSSQENFYQGIFAAWQKFDFTSHVP